MKERQWQDKRKSLNEESQRKKQGAQLQAQAFPRIVGTRFSQCLQLEIGEWRGLLQKAKGRHEEKHERLLESPELNESGSPRQHLPCVVLWPLIAQIKKEQTHE